MGLDARTLERMVEDISTKGVTMVERSFFSILYDKRAILIVIMLILPLLLVMAQDGFNIEDEREITTYMEPVHLLDAVLMIPSSARRGENLTVSAMVVNWGDSTQNIYLDVSLIDPSSIDDITGIPVFTPDLGSGLGIGPDTIDLSQIPGMDFGGVEAKVLVNGTSPIVPIESNGMVLINATITVPDDIPQSVPIHIMLRREGVDEGMALIQAAQDSQVMLAQYDALNSIKSGPVQYSAAYTALFNDDFGSRYDTWTNVIGLGGVEPFSIEHINRSQITFATWQRPEFFDEDINSSISGVITVPSITEGYRSWLEDVEDNGSLAGILGPVLGLSSDESVALEGIPLDLLRYGLPQETVEKLDNGLYMYYVDDLSISVRAEILTGDGLGGEALLDSVPWSIMDMDRSVNGSSFNMNITSGSLHEGPSQEFILRLWTNESGSISSSDTMFTASVYKGFNGTIRNVTGETEPQVYLDVTLDLPLITSLGGYSLYADPGESVLILISVKNLQNEQANSTVSVTLGNVTETYTTLVPGMSIVNGFVRFDGADIVDGRHPASISIGHTDNSTGTTEYSSIVLVGEDAVTRVGLINSTYVSHTEWKVDFFEDISIDEEFLLTGTVMNGGVIGKDYGIHVLNNDSSVDLGEEHFFIEAGGSHEFSVMVNKTAYLPGEKPEFFLELRSNDTGLDESSDSIVIEGLGVVKPEVITGPVEERAGVRLFSFVFIYFFLTFAGVVVGLIYGSGMISSENDTRTTELIFTSPISKNEVVVYKYLGYVLSTFILLVVPFVLIYLYIMGSRSPGYIVDNAPLLGIAIFVLFMALCAYGAIFMLLGSLTKQPFMFGTLFLLIEMLLANVGFSLQKITIGHYLKSSALPLLEKYIPDASASLNLQNSSGALLATAQGTAYAVIFFLVIVCLFLNIMVLKMRDLV